MKDEDMFADGDGTLDGDEPVGYDEAGKVITKAKATTNSYNSARARNELAKAIKNEIDALKAQGEVVMVAAVEQAQATAIQSFVQTLRTIPDILERQYGLEPRQVEAVSAVIDTALNSLAGEMQMFGE